MPQVALYNQQGAQVGEIVLNETIFGIEPHKQAMFDAVIMQRASMRQGTHKTKLVLRYVVVDVNLGNKKVLDVLVKDLSVHLNGVVEESYSDQFHVAMHTN